MSEPYRTLLYATDLGPGSRRIFHHALLTARLHGAKLHVLHVLPEVEEAVIQSVAAVMGQQRLIDNERQHMAEEVAALRQRFIPTADAEVAQMEEHLIFAGRSGRPVTSILHYAAEIGADLIVIGAHRKGVLRPAFLGTVAERLLRRSHLPVLVVPPVD